MKVSKKYVNNIDYEIVLKNEKDEKFKIYFYDSYLYWTMVDYYDGNAFVIDSNDDDLFNYFNCLFEKIKKYDNNSNSLIEGNIFRWKSENDIIINDASELVIICQDSRFIVKFIRNKRDFLSKFHGSCDICFNLNYSKYQDIVHLFNMIYINYEEKTSGKVKSRKL